MTRRPAPAVDEATRAALVGERVGLLREILERRGAAGILLDSRRDFAWLTLGGQNHILNTTETGVAPILVTRDDAVVFAPVNEYDRIADEEAAGLPLRLVSTPWWQSTAALDHARKAVGNGRLTTAGDAANDLEALRSLLSPTEHARLEWLADAVLDAAGSVLDTVRAGTNEDDVVSGVTSALAAHAVRMPVVLVAADDRIERYRHPISASRAVRDRLMLVLVAERWGLHVAHTQFLELRESPAKIADAAAKVADVLAAMRTATVPGNTLGHVIAAAQSAYARAGMPDEWTLHHQGGTIGYQARERIATPGDQTPIRAGMAFAWNPSAVGVKREETLYLDANGAQRVLTTTPD